MTQKMIIAYDSYGSPIRDGDTVMLKETIDSGRITTLSARCQVHDISGQLKCSGGYTGELDGFVNYRKPDNDYERSQKFIRALESGMTCRVENNAREKRNSKAGTRRKLED